ncbi:MAG TPA: AAA family ATPase [Ktedonobacteraceae bacterium]|jgi:predicted kinase|nr:AAA family ATPase [Ktedonobacteraceae bacterium]
MESMRRDKEDPAFCDIALPRRSLLVLCGPAGCGKSTFASAVLKQQRPPMQPTAIVSSDHCRALVCDDENNQQVNRDTFDLFYYIIHKRMFQNRFTIADSTALQPDARQRLLELAKKHQYSASIIVFNIDEHVCIERDRQRKRLVGSQVITYHTGLLQQALHAIPEEGWSQVYELSGSQRARVRFL